MSLKFGLNLKNKAPPTSLSTPGAKSASKKKKPLLDDEDDSSAAPKTTDHAQEISDFNLADTLAPSSAPSPPKPTSSKPPKGQPPSGPPTRKPKPKADDPTLVAHSASAREAEQRAQDALQVDSKLYDYDAAYDALHAAEALKKAALAADPNARAPRYMDSLFSAAEQRKADQARARDKLLQRERAHEGDAFADKEKFVTDAYKLQQAEHAQLEAAEQARAAQEEHDRRLHGMANFHKHMLQDREDRHVAAMLAAEKARTQGLVVPVPAADDDDARKSEAERVQELRRQGKTVLLNDDGNVADKRDLLSAGLNVVAKPKPPPPAVAVAVALSARPDPVAHGAPPKGGGRAAQRQRQTQIIAQQLEAAAKRKADQEADEAAKMLHKSKSQKTEADVLSAKERYLARKREAAAAKDKAAK
ncbi:hypothetical protein ACEQ8H_008974 [Pleosporales sp. CAS-2024a]